MYELTSSRTDALKLYLLKIFQYIEVFCMENVYYMCHDYQGKIIGMWNFLFNLNQINYPKLIIKSTVSVTIKDE